MNTFELLKCAHFLQFFLYLYIVPFFKDKYIENIQTCEIQDFLTDISNSGKNRTAKKIYQLLNPLFDYAVADGVISLSPMAKVKLARYEEKHGVPLTVEEEYALLKEIKCNPSVYNQAYAFILYTGLRRAELASVVIDGDWITLTTAKQRKGMKEKSRSIPISPMLKGSCLLLTLIKSKPHPSGY